MRLPAPLVWRIGSWSLFSDSGMDLNRSGPIQATFSIFLLRMETRRIGIAGEQARDASDEGQGSNEDLC